MTEWWREIIKDVECQICDEYNGGLVQGETAIVVDGCWMCRYCAGPDGWERGMAQWREHQAALEKQHREGGVKI